MIREVMDSSRDFMLRKKLLTNIDRRYIGTYRGGREG